MKTKVGETSNGYQLKRLSETAARIKNEVLRRLEGRRHVTTYNVARSNRQTSQRR